MHLFPVMADAGCVFTEDSSSVFNAQAQPFFTRLASQ
jgi:hypothetical protein